MPLIIKRLLKNIWWRRALIEERKKEAGANFLVLRFTNCPAKAGRSKKRDL